MRISVLMGVYNAEKTLREALESIFNQTYQDFELIICDDGSTDSSLDILTKYSHRFPNKIKLIIHDVNKGLNETLNDCLNIAKGEYIARMDADDISLPMRFQKQVEFLDSNPELAFVGTNMIHFDDSGDWGISTLIKIPQKKDMVKGSSFSHPSILMRRSALLQVGGYTVSPRLLRVEDYHLWIKMYEYGFYGYNLREPLIKFRDDKDAQARRTISNRLNEIYVKHLAIHKLKLPIYNYVYIMKPLLLILVPASLYKLLHQFKLKR
ncbi:glycosyltransferase [Streptococcus suis]|uniref:glycosyltransferase n=1 Tax=Streptococcus suis TaxID=1307 RepID=UPI002FC73091